LVKSIKFSISYTNSIFCLMDRYSRVEKLYSENMNSFFSKVISYVHKLIEPKFSDLNKKSELNFYFQNRKLALDQKINYHPPHAGKEKSNFT